MSTHFITVLATRNQIIAQANAGAPPEGGGADMGLGGGGGAPLDMGMGGSIDNNENAMGLGQEAPPNAGNAPEGSAVPEEAPI